MFFDFNSHFQPVPRPPNIGRKSVVRVGSMKLSVGKGPRSLIHMGGIVGTEYLNCIQDIYEKLALHSQEQKWNQKLRYTYEMDNIVRYICDGQDVRDVQDERDLHDVWVWEYWTMTSARNQE